MDKCVNVAFVGTAEAAAESEIKTFDGIFGPEDEGPVLQDEDEVDREQELLEAMPLPGNPVKEQERTKKWLALPARPG